jgi:hypothetical protein
MHTLALCAFGSTLQFFLSFLSTRANVPRQGISYSTYPAGTELLFNVGQVRTL